jgi:hypothetical protein
MVAMMGLGIRSRNRSLPATSGPITQHHMLHLATFPESRAANMLFLVIYLIYSENNNILRYRSSFHAEISS